MMRRVARLVDLIGKMTEHLSFDLRHDSEMGG